MGNGNLWRCTADDYTWALAASIYPRLAIIIDDFGSSGDGVKEMMSIDRHLTFAVMPFLITGCVGMIYINIS